MKLRDFRFRPRVCPAKFRDFKFHLRIIMPEKDFFSVEFVYLKVKPIYLREEIFDTGSVFHRVVIRIILRIIGRVIVRIVFRTVRYDLIHVTYIWISDIIRYIFCSSLRGVRNHAGGEWGRGYCQSSRCISSSCDVPTYFSAHFKWENGVIFTHNSHLKGDRIWSG